MPGNTKEIRRRIASVSNTRQITKAMELVAAVKMRKAQEATLATRAYSEKAWNLIHSVSSGVDETVHPLLALRPLRKACVIVISPDRGLCGSLNSNIMKKANDVFREFQKNGVAFDVIAVGKKIRHDVVARKFSLIAEFEAFDKTLTSSDVYPISQLCVKGFIEGVYDAVTLVYTDFVSTLVQNVTVRELLPLRAETEAGELGQVGLGATTHGENEAPMTTKVAMDEVSAPSGSSRQPEYEFEPSTEELLNEMLPRLTEMQIFQALLESSASEHSARMVAMKNASESADELIDALTLKFNQARQAGITREIAEISAGMTALE